MMNLPLWVDKVFRKETVIVYPRAAPGVSDKVAVSLLNLEVVDRDAFRVPRARQALDDQVRPGTGDDFAADADLPPLHPSTRNGCSGVAATVSITFSVGGSASVTASGFAGRFRFHAGRPFPSPAAGL
jgi:hypothetical protein